MDSESICEANLEVEAMTMKQVTFVVVAAGMVAAQEYRGTILGRITDPSGAAVVGASVELALGHPENNTQPNPLLDIFPATYTLGRGATITPAPSRA